MSTINERYGKATGREHARCPRCARLVPAGELNFEAYVHHDAGEVICIDRQTCERAKRKAKRRAR